MKIFDGYGADPKNPLAHVRVECGGRQRQLVDYGVRDAKGRAVGGLVVTWVETYIDDETGNTLVPVSRVGQTRFKVELHSTRNGQTFGAIPSATSHAEAVDAHKHVERAIARAKKRAQKVHA